MTKDKTKDIESRTADTVLQRPVKVTVGDMEYEVQPPTLATLIAISELSAQLPEVAVEGLTGVAPWVIRNARECRILTRMIAILILGVQRPQYGRKGRWGRDRDEEADLLEKALMNTTPRELMKIVMSLLGGLQIADFFQLTAFLKGIDLTKATTTTASGPASRE